MDLPAKRPIAFILGSTNHGAMIINRNDFREVDAAAYGVGFQLLSTSSFDHEEVNLVLQLLDARRQRYGDGVVAIDCGANIGVHTLEWAKHMHGWGEIIAFEAQERIFYALAGNLALNNCFNARAIWAAVGAKDGEINVPIPDYHLPASFGSLELRPSSTNEDIGQVINYDEDHTARTRLLSIDELKLARIDLMKVDVEGMELEVLEGSRSAIEQFRPQLLIESIKSGDAAIRSFAEGYGYKVFPAGLNLLAVHESDPTWRDVQVV